MGYINLSDACSRIYVQTGMVNRSQDAEKSARQLSELLKQPAGYLNNGTEGLMGDVGEYLPTTLAMKDVLNEYTYRTLNARSPVLIVTHSAGNEDARKALSLGALYGHRYDNLSLISLGSPISASRMQEAAEKSGMHFLGQVNDWRDPVTYSKTAGTVSLGSFLGGLGYGAVQGSSADVGGGLLGCVLGGIAGGVAGGIPGVAGFYGLQTYHPFDRYLQKPEVQNILFDWQKKQGQ